MANLLDHFINHKPELQKMSSKTYHDLLVVAIHLHMIWPLKLFSANGVFERETEKYIVQKMSSKTYHDIPSVTHTKPSSLVETTSAFSSFGKILPGFFSNLKLSNLIRMYQVQTRFLGFILKLPQLLATSNFSALLNFYSVPM